MIFFVCCVKLIIMSVWNTEFEILLFILVVSFFGLIDENLKTPDLLVIRNFM